MTVRPGIVAGSFDPTNRFTYWVMRFAAGGPILVPKVADSRLELIDVRDLAAFMVKGLEDRLIGAFNAAGPPSRFGSMIETCQALNPAATPVWADVATLGAAGIALGSDLPLAVKADEDALFAAISQKAVDHGLTYRSLAETAQDVIQWKAGLKDEAPPRSGMSREKELAALEGLIA